MTASALLSPGQLVVAPGATTSTDLRVRNSSGVVDEFTFQSLGDAADWISVEPPMVRLLPGTDAVVTVTIAPPRAPSTSPGSVVWAVKTISHEDPDGASVAEGTVVVGEFADLSAELQPSTGHGRLAGRFDLATDNRGNVPLAVRVAGTDAAQALAFNVTQPGFDAKAGSATFSRLKVKPVDRIWFGQPKSHAFQMLVSARPSAALPDEQSPDSEASIVPVVLNGTFVQDPVVPKWLLKAVLITATLLLLLFVLWKTLVQPTVESAARSIAHEEVEAVDDSVAELVEAVDAQAQRTQQAQEAAADAAEQAQTASEEAADVAAAVETADSVAPAEPAAPDDSSGILSDTSNPTNFRLSVTALPGASGANAWQADTENTLFALTDVVLQNPGGDVGRVRVLIDGSPILESSLENFRDLDFHFISPYVVGAGSNVSIEVDCAIDQVDGGPCDPAVSFAGFTTSTTEAS
ncbi:MAG TPA: hypothetical protein VFD53_08595 [Ilumatobacter sp.]|nr:hypothetical protein [Ilumatobacter sp.]